jgi:hypothetical protein
MNMTDYYKELLLRRECLKLPDSNKLKSGICESAPVVPVQLTFETLFETHWGGFAPAQRYLF